MRTIFLVLVSLPFFLVLGYEAFIGHASGATETEFRSVGKIWAQDFTESYKIAKAQADPVVWQEFVPVLRMRALDLAATFALLWYVLVAAGDLLSHFTQWRTSVRERSLMVSDSKDLAFLRRNRDLRIKYKRK